MIFSLEILRFNVKRTYNFASNQHLFSPRKISKIFICDNKVIKIEVIHDLIECEEVTLILWNMNLTCCSFCQK